MSAHRGGLTYIFRSSVVDFKSFLRSFMAVLRVQVHPGVVDEHMRLAVLSLELVGKASHTLGFGDV